MSIKTKIQSRIRSKLAWTTTISLILFMLKTYFKVDIPNIDQLVDLILLELTVIGIFNDPTNPDGY
jgi:uncharacterized membrane protein